MSGNMYIFEIGNDYAEENYPYYHILEDAEVIRKRGRGTSKSKGSQAQIEKLSQRDYGPVTKACNHCRCDNTCADNTDFHNSTSLISMYKYCRF